eukprot:Filipodium_phascolosomae@DN1784_c0_g1_i2.p1
MFSKRLSFNFFSGCCGVDKKFDRTEILIKEDEETIRSIENPAQEENRDDLGDLDAKIQNCCLQESELKAEAVDSPVSTPSVVSEEATINNDSNDEFYSPLDTLAVVSGPKKMVCPELVCKRLPSWEYFQMSNPDFPHGAPPLESPIILNCPGIRIRPEDFIPKQRCLCKGCQDDLQLVPCCYFEHCRNIGQEAVEGLKNLLATSKWKPQNKDKEAFSICTASGGANKKFHVIKATKNLGKVSFHSVVALLEKVQTKKYFDDSFLEGYHLKYFNEDVGLLYHRYQGMMGVPGRNFVCVAYIERYNNASTSCGNEERTVIAIKSTELPRNVENFLKNDTVRAEIILAGYEVKKLQDGTVEVTAISQVDLKSSAPSFVQNGIQLNQMKNLMVGVNDVIQKHPVEFQLCSE